MRAGVRIFFMAAACAAFFAAGFLTHRDGRLAEIFRGLTQSTIEATPTSADRPAGEWLPLDRATGPRAEDRDMLASIGYAGDTGLAPAAQSGVTLHDPTRTHAGLNLYISGHAPEAVLMDMAGRVRHRWAHEFSALWPGYHPPDYVRITGQHYWRRVHAYPNGDLLALHEGIGLVKLDRDSKVLWKRRDNFHHDFAVTADGSIYALNRTMEPRPAAPDEEPFVMEPILSVLDANGAERQRIPLLPTFENSAHASLLARMSASGDLFHENTIQVFDGSLADRSPLFVAGNVLISIWTLDTIAILNPAEQRIVWAMTGMWHRQHESALLRSGNMIVFDNRGNRGGSRVLEFDPFTQQVVWSYAPEDPAEFHSEWCGGLQRLENGNTLVTETNKGRAFELTPDGEIVWEFINPNQTTSRGMTLVASLWKVTRLPEDYGADWLHVPGR